MFHSLIFNTHTMWLRRPGGGHRIATFMREQGWNVEVLDWAADFTLEELQEFSRSRVTDNTKIIGFSCFFSYWDKKMESFTKWFKETYPEVVIVYGSQARPKMESNYFDYYMFGFGEYAMLQVMKVVAGNELKSSIKLDINWLAKGKKVIDAIHMYPAFPMKSLMIKYEDRDYIEPWEWLTVEYARGCKFECAYCNFPVLGVKGDYTRDADNYIEQLTDAYDRFGITNYFVADETFNDTTEKMIKFADATEKLPFKPWQSGFMRADLLVSRPEDKEHALRMGFLGHYYGVETFNHAAGKAVGKGMNPDKLKAGLLDIKKYFESNGTKRYRAVTAFVLGLPHETEESITSTLEWLVKNWQGQAVDISPLEIPINEFVDKPSKISKDWKKYGYRESTNELHDLNYRHNDLVQVNQVLNWENDSLSYAKVREIADAFTVYNHKAKLFGLNPYILDWGVVYTNSLQGALDLRSSDLRGVDDKHIEMIVRYKAKKLGSQDVTPEGRPREYNRFFYPDTHATTSTMISSEEKTKEFSKKFDNIINDA